MWSLTGFKGSTLHRTVIAVPWVGGQARMCTYLRNVLKLHEEEGIEEQNMNLNPDPNILYFTKPIECNNSTLHHKPFHECYL